MGQRKDQSNRSPQSAGPALPHPIPGKGGDQQGRPPARVWWCRQEEKEEAVSPLAHTAPLTPGPISGPRGPANRMEVGAGGGREVWRRH